MRVGRGSIRHHTRPVPGMECKPRTCSENPLTLGLFVPQPAVSSDCATNFWADYAYCVGVDSSASSTSVPSSTNASSSTSVQPTSTTALPTPDHPTQTGAIDTCNAWYTIASGDSCTSIETAFDITHAQFLEWNVSFAPVHPKGMLKLTSYSLRYRPTARPTSGSTIPTALESLPAHPPRPHYRIPFYLPRRARMYRLTKQLGLHGHRQKRRLVSPRTVSHSHRLTEGCTEVCRQQMEVCPFR
jgi:hypothetical protein